MLFLPLAFIWAFALVDIFRREDISGWSKALWVTCVIFLPFLGTLIYLVVRPSGATREERLMIDDASGDYARYSPSNGVSELRALPDLHDRRRRLVEPTAGLCERRTVTKGARWKTAMREGSARDSGSPSSESASGPE
jgi:Phospholipase_D-nuclease N-terminal